MSKIEWTEKTWNPVIGCSRVSAGCQHCYAETMSARLASMGGDVGALYEGLTTKGANGETRFTGVVKCLPERLDEPLKRKKSTVYFVNSMSDLFHPNVPFEFIDRVFAVMAACPQHTFQILTKRPERMKQYFEGNGVAAFKRIRYELGGWFALEVGQKLFDKVYDSFALPLPNVWLGTSVENQETANKRIPLLLETPAAVRFLSCEPLLGAVDLDLRISDYFWHNALTGQTILKEEYDEYYGNGSKINWVVCGGESGCKARPMNLDWARSLRDQCKAAGVPYFFKQVGGTNKKKTGRLLDGVEHNEYPINYSL